MSIFKNYIYNTLYQIVNLLIPFITIPYLTRVFNPYQLGLNAYTFSIVTYFTFFGMLGMQMYGNRQIAYVRNDKKKLSTTFWSLFIVQLTTTLISALFYLIFIFVFLDNNINVYIVQGMLIFSYVFDISWLFMGLEDFKKISVRNMLIKLVGLIFILIFVRNDNQLITYILANSTISILGSLVMWFYVPQYVDKFNIDINIIKKTIVPLIMIFLPQIASQIYTTVSNTLIGTLSTTEEVIFYDYSQKIVRMSLGLITSIGTVLMPRISNMLFHGQVKEIRDFIFKTFKIVSYICMPMAIGLMVISNNLVSWFLGSKYLEVGKLLAISSSIIIAVSWANIIGIQYLIATKQENKYTLSVVLSACISFFINIILIKKIGAYGAAISIVVAEYSGIFIQMFLSRKQLPIFKMLSSSVNYLISSIFMAILIYPLGNIIGNKIIANLIQVISGIFIYVVIMIIIKDTTQYEFSKKIIVILKKFKK